MGLPEGMVGLSLAGTEQHQLPALPLRPKWEATSSCGLTASLIPQPRSRVRPLALLPRPQPSDPFLVPPPSSRDTFDR